MNALCIVSKMSKISESWIPLSTVNCLQAQITAPVKDKDTKPGAVGSDPNKP